jgi:hypothetical protein
MLLCQKVDWADQRIRIVKLGTTIKYISLCLWTHTAINNILQNFIKKEKKEII